MKRAWEIVMALTLLAGLAGAGSEFARADDFSSTNYKINGVVGNSFGGDTASTAYKLTSSGGESIVGNGAGGSYKLGEGYVAQLERSLQLSVASSMIDFGTIMPGTSTTKTNTVTVQTDAPSYNVLVGADTDLKSASNTIAASGLGTIAAPNTWAEGTTKGLGFSVASSTPALPAAWGSGSKYAAIPTTATSFFTRSATTGNVNDGYGLNLRLDVPPLQAAGTYMNTVTFTGLLNP